MDTRRFNNIKTLTDIKHEKARLRYELLVIETELNESLSSFKSISTYTSVFARVGYGFTIGKKIYSIIHGLVSKIISWRKKKKNKKKNRSSHEE
jgi:hypothetical protein